MTPNPLPSLERFNGASAWAMLKPEVQAAIGAIALEYIINIEGLALPLDFQNLTARDRAFIAADALLSCKLHETVCDALHSHVPAALGGYQIPIPSQLGQICRVCGCSEFDPCREGCGWSEDDLCTACKAAEAA